MMRAMCSSTEDLLVVAWNVNVELRALDSQTIDRTKQKECIERGSFFYPFILRHVGAVDKSTNPPTAYN